MITSVSNKKIREVIQLNEKSSARKKAGAFVIEGVRLFLEAPEEEILEVYVAASFMEGVAEISAKDRKNDKTTDADTLSAGEEKARRDEAMRKLSSLSGRTETVADDVFKKMSDTKTPQGILCVMRKRDNEVRDLREKSLLLILEDMQDPGNLGTVFRTAEAAGVGGIIMSKGTVDIYSPKVVRSTMGAIFRVPFAYAQDLGKEIEGLRRKGTAVYAAHLDNSTFYDEEDYTKPTAFLIGNEGNGLKRETADLADKYIRIPMEGCAESLNASVAASILAYEAYRQRRKV